LRNKHDAVAPALGDRLLRDAVALFADTDGVERHFDMGLVYLAGYIMALVDAPEEFRYGGLAQLRFTFDVSQLATGLEAAHRPICNSLPRRKCLPFHLDFHQHVDRLCLLSAASTKYLRQRSRPRQSNWPALHQSLTVTLQDEGNDDRCAR
jgi:hypothetical protein